MAGRVAGYGSIVLPSDGEPLTLGGDGAAETRRRGPVTVLLLLACTAVAMFSLGQRAGRASALTAASPAGVVDVVVAPAASNATSAAADRGSVGDIGEAVLGADPAIDKEAEQLCTALAYTKDYPDYASLLASSMADPANSKLQAQEQERRLLEQRVRRLSANEQKRERRRAGLDDSQNGHGGDDRPNVLLIIADDLNDWAGAAADSDFISEPTPALDAFSKSATLFQEAHSAAPVCGPSRVALLTGMAPHVSGIMKHGEARSWRDVAKLRTVRTLPGLFKNEGYRVLGAGKTFHNARLNSPPELEGYDQGSWDGYFPMARVPYCEIPNIRHPPTETKSHIYHRPREAERTEYAPRFGIWDPEQSGMTAANRTAAASLPDEQIASWFEWLMQHPEHLRHAPAAGAGAAAHRGGRGKGGANKAKGAETPWFVALGLHQPHLDWFVRADTLALFDGAHPPGRVVHDEDDLPHLALTLKEVGSTAYEATSLHDRTLVAQYYLAAVRQMDQVLGRILKALDGSPYAKSTVVVFTSDHGWHAAGEKSQYLKFTVWRRVTHVPLLIRVPAGVSAALPQGTDAGSSVATPVSHLDLFPTLAALAGIDASSAEGETGEFGAPVDLTAKRGAAAPLRQGHSLLPLLRKPTVRGRRLGSALVASAANQERWNRAGVMTSTAVTKKREAVHAVTDSDNSYRLITYGSVTCDRAAKCCAGEMELYNVGDGDKFEVHNLCVLEHNLCHVTLHDHGSAPGGGTTMRGCGGALWDPLTKMMAVRQELLTPTASAPARSQAHAPAARSAPKSRAESARLEAEAKAAAALAHRKPQPRAAEGRSGGDSTPVHAEPKPPPKKHPPHAKHRVKTRPGASAAPAAAAEPPAPAAPKAAAAGTPSAAAVPVSAEFIPATAAEPAAAPALTGSSELLRYAENFVALQEAQQEAQQGAQPQQEELAASVDTAEPAATAAVTGKRRAAEKRRKGAHHAHHHRHHSKSQDESEAPTLYIMHSG